MLATYGSQVACWTELGAATDKSYGTCWAEFGGICWQPTCLLDSFGAGWTELEGMAATYRFHRACWTELGAVCRPTVPVGNLQQVLWAC